MKNDHEHIGSSLTSFLEEEGLYESCKTEALKEILAWQIQEEMRKQQLTKTAVAKKMETSRSQLDRLLDPSKLGISLEMLHRAAQALGKDLHIELRDAR